MLEALHNDHNLLWLGTALYLLAFTYALLALAANRRHRLIVFYLLLTIGFVFQGFGLYRRGLSDQSFPLNNTFEILMLMGWSAVMLEFIVRPAFRLRLLGFFTTGLAGGLGALALAIPSWDTPVIPPQTPANPWIGFHAAMAVFSYGVFALLAMTALMYLLQHYALRGKQGGGLFERLPSLKQLDTINQRLLLMGVSLLSLAIALGFANWANHPEGLHTHKLWAAMVVWALYLSAHRLRVKKLLIASQFAWACILLFAIALLSLWPLSPPHP